VSNSAARFTSNLGFNTVASTWSSGAFTAIGVTHEYGLSPFKRYKYVVSPVALTTGPFTRVVLPMNGSLNFSTNLSCDFTESGLTPRTIAPAFLNSEKLSRNAQASFVQPGVSSRG